MIPSDQFVLFYNEIFKLLEAKGPEHLRKYYDRIAARQGEFTKKQFKALGLKGMFEYWERIRIEENCDSWHNMDPNGEFLEGGQNVCPSLTKALTSDAGACKSYCNHCPGWVMPIFTDCGYYAVYDIISRTEPKCYDFISKNRDLVEDRYSERLAMHGTDLVSTNAPIGMVKGSIAESKKFEGLHPRFKKVFEWLRNTDLKALKKGRNEIDGDEIYANVMENKLQPWNVNATMEVHRAYFDIHVPIFGDETLGYLYDEADVKAKEKEFNVKDDYVLFKNQKLRKIEAKKGEFVVFYPPYAAHAPWMSERNVGASHKKLVVKVKM